jgi:arylsulfatase A-like enzyme
MAGTSTNRGRRIAVATIALCVIAGLSAPWGQPGAAAGPASAARPSFLVVMTDDQRLDDLTATVAGKPLMPNTRNLIGARGVTFSRAYASYPLSCPSRTTFLTGLYAHNHGVTANHRPETGYCGGPGNFPAAGSLAPRLQKAGYETIIGGRYLNGFPGPRPKTTTDPGWSRWAVSVSDQGSEGARYLDFRLNQDGAISPLFTGGSNYFTDVVSEQVGAAIERTPPSKPFFAWIAHRAPHEDVEDPVGPEPAPRHRSSTSKIPVPRTASFNEANVADKPEYLSMAPPLSSAEKRQILERAQRRRASLRAVDESVKSLIGVLAEAGRLSDTYVIFVSDNGFFLGEHRFPKGKVRAYEQSSRIPLLMRGPGIPAGASSAELVANVDLAPTILGLARRGAPFDGRSLMPFARQPARRSRRPLLLESFRDPIPGANPRNARIASPNYYAIVLGRYKLVRYVTGESELYDLARDPEELRNVFADPAYRDAREYLAARLAALRDCRGFGCRSSVKAAPDPASPGPLSPSPRGS